MSENSFIAILNRMKDRITTEADRREGTWTADNLQAVANELARVYAEDIEDILPQAFVITAVGKNLDSACSDYGITRREATKAETVVEVTGDPGNYSGVTGYAGEIAFLLDDFVIEGVGAVQVRAVCMTAGEQGNVAAGSITEADSIHIRKITNPEDAEGGYDRESDNVLRQRALEHIRTPAISGNIAHYIQWAKEIPGVHKVKVFDLVRGNGTVDVVLIANDNEPAPESLVTDVAEYIESQRPIGADVLVTSAEAVELQVEAAVLVKSGYTESMVTARLQELLDRYCEDTAFLSTVVSYLGIVALVFDCPGVVDVENARINGQEKSLILTARQFPVALPVRISVKEVADA